MNRHVRLLPPALLLAAGCASTSEVATPQADRTAVATAAGPSRSRTGDPERMRKVGRFPVNDPATITPSAHTPLPGHPFRIGALFYNDNSGDHFCTASVVSSPKKNMLITAAHCVHGGPDGDYKRHMVFVPQYREGEAPRGSWTVKSVIVDNRWAHRADPDLDVGFLTVAPLNGRNIEDVLGANKLGVNEGFSNVVRVIGYPSNGDDPISCVNVTTKQSDYQMRFACNGYVGGTSGSPWLTHYDRVTHTGHIVGVIGGYQEGGGHQEVSYSPYFDSDIKALYDTAVAKS